MKDAFGSPQSVISLEIAARSWLGTPFAGNSNAKGRGVSCQMLAAEIYAECGLDVGDIPEAPMAHSRFSKVSLVEPFIDALPGFRSVPLPQAGDLLGFRLGRVVHHLGIMLLGGVFVHCVEGPGVLISPIADATWSGRLQRIWRPQI